MRMLATAGPTVAPRRSTNEEYERAGCVELTGSGSAGRILHVRLRCHGADGDQGCAFRALVGDHGRLVGFNLGPLAGEFVNLDQLVAVVMEHRQARFHPTQRASADSAARFMSSASLVM
jgi:hypothetical protein